MSEHTDVVDRQVDAYNAHDVDAFSACYSPDVVIRSGAGLALMVGTETIAQRYAALFTAHADVAVRLEGRLEMGDWVIDREVVTLSGTEHTAAAAYHVQDGLIESVILLY